jgi:hypothetical protein
LSYFLTFKSVPRFAAFCGTLADMTFDRFFRRTCGLIKECS